MKRRKQLSILLFVTFVVVNSLPAQFPYYKKTWLKVNEGREQDSLIFGLCNLATYGMDTLLGEFEGPPSTPPPDVGFAWWIDPRGGNYGVGIGDLFQKDIRRLTDEPQIDTFEVEFRPDLGFQATFYLPDRSVWFWDFDSLILHDGLTNGSVYNIDISHAESLKVIDSSVHSMLVYAYSNSIVYGVKGKNVPIPATFSLRQNYPNPFNPVTTIRFELPAKSVVNLGVYNLLGEKIRTLLFGEQNAGVHEINFDGSNVSSGVYFYRLQTRDVTLTRKLTILK
ncbi:MAG: T9SS type A sorting domain-containing protein [Bacteroidota bacterium]|jgi:hypothetical protein